MTGFEPGEGWRLVADDEVLEPGATVVTYSNGAGIYRAWLCLESQPLPTEPYTVIRTGPMRWMKSGLYVHPDGSKGNPDAWVLLPFHSQTERRAITAANLAVMCTYDAGTVREQAAEFGFEVLAEPVDREKQHGERLA